MMISLYYWFYLANPDDIPSNKQLVEKMNRVFPAANVAHIQDKIRLDEKHIFIPFISSKDEYGVSYWIWTKHKWELVNINTTGSPEVWNIKEKNPSTHFIVWNIHPDDQLETIKFHLLKDRGYRIADGVERYHPKVQMEETISLKENSYGAISIPEDWTQIIKSYRNIEPVQSFSFFNHYGFSQYYIYYGWTSYDQYGNQTFPGNSVNGNGYSNRDYNIDFMMIMDEAKLESK
ncbi:hypothetical protein [Chengkuizengella axinellae]|uniref:Uncharacterized protein n=1 Tax=Chengkuizengella axinellae TaxID=3064388 RepID=A0ABT9J3T1_9BACL|nr:hypothetical protein [Chengkuizengella sp. 2205SS18-9]MDP5276261.1 hypothetical protein [Chengkuizengella sp. 2205SS18-9]